MVETSTGNREELLSDLFATLWRTSFCEKIIKELCKSRITYTQFEVLRYIERHPFSSIGELAHALKISYPSATNISSRLAHKGLIYKTGTYPDKRIAHLEISPQGREIVLKVVAERKRRLMEVFELLDDDDRLNMLDTIHRFIIAASKANIAEPVDLCRSCGPDRYEDCPLLKTGESHECG
ncbi:MAG TPA: MarR family transcriptional regulator [Fimbriimonadales bacterium]|nr:MarR family transcriptional regulator [Fimbriimonadales bacterium]